MLSVRITLHPLEIGAITRQHVARLETSDLQWWACNSEVLLEHEKITNGRRLSDRI